MKRAQAAMEFLMTYGWAILVVLVAIGALAYFGVLSPEKILPEKCVISPGSGLFCDKFNVVAGNPGTITLRIKNSLSDDVTIKATSSTIGSCAVQSDVAVSADGTADVSFTGTGCTLSSGDKLKEDLKITYDIGGFQKTATGTFVARVP